MFLPSTSLQVMGEIAGVKTVTLGGCRHSLETRARWVEGFHNEHNTHVFNLERDGLCQVVLYLWVTIRETSNHTIPDRSQPGWTRTTPSAIHQDGGVKHSTGASSKVCGRDNIAIGTWNTRTLRVTGKLQELTHEVDRYRWTPLDSVKWDGRTLVTQQQRKDTRFSSMEKRINMSMALDFLFTRTLWILSCDVNQSPAGSSPSAWG